MCDGEKCILLLCAWKPDFIKSSHKYVYLLALSFTHSAFIEWYLLLMETTKYVIKLCTVQITIHYSYIGTRDNKLYNPFTHLKACSDFFGVWTINLEIIYRMIWLMLLLYLSLRMNLTNIWKTCYIHIVVNDHCYIS